MMAIDLSNIKAVVLDIEGTTTSISFVKETLFPYARTNLEEFLNTKWDVLAEERTLLREQAKKDVEDKLEGAIAIEDGDKEKESLVKSVLWQMDADRKTGALKRLQGLIWEKGYADGVFKGHLYSDVAEALNDWKSASRGLYVYSSGSVDGQKLLFKHSVSGDLVGLFAGFFDTSVGAKTDKESYVKITAEVGKAAEEILFLTDVPKEAEAAKSAGLQVALVIREGNAPLSAEDAAAYTTIHSFSEIMAQPCAKRTKREEPQEEKPAPNVTTDEKMEVAAEPTKAETDKTVESMETETSAEVKEDTEAKDISKEPAAEKATTETTEPEVAKEEKKPAEEAMESDQTDVATEAVNGSEKPAEEAKETKKIEEVEAKESKKIEEIEAKETKKIEEIEASTPVTEKKAEADTKDADIKAEANGTEAKVVPEVNGADIKSVPEINSAEVKVVPEVNGAEVKVVPEVNGAEVKIAPETNGESDTVNGSEPEVTKEPSNGTANGAEKPNGQHEETEPKEQTNGKATNGSDEIATKKEEMSEVKAKTVESVATPVVEVATE